MPSILWYLEANPARKKWLSFALAAGIAVATLSIINFYTRPVIVEVVNHHIAYQQTMPFPFSTELYYLGLFVYLIATAGALFISTIPHASIMGALVLLAFVVAHIWYALAMGSVWCFFAAACSALIILAMA